LENRGTHGRHADIIKGKIVRVVSKAKLQGGAGGRSGDEVLRVHPAVGPQIELVEEGGGAPVGQKLVGTVAVVIDQPEADQIKLARRGRQRLRQVIKRSPPARSWRRSCRSE